MRWRQFLIQRLQGPVARSTTRPRRQLPLGIYKCDGIGDFVLALGAIRQLSERWGAANTALIVATTVAGLARREFPQAEVIAIPPKWGHLVRGAVPLWFQERRRLASFDFEVLVTLRHQRMIAQELMLSWLSARRTIGMANNFQCISPADAAAFSFRHEESLTYPVAAPAGLCLELEAHRQLVGRALGRELTASEILPRLRSFDELVGQAIVVCPFGGHPIRDYPQPQLVEVLAVLGRELAAPLVICGAARDQQRLRHLLAAARARGIQQLSLAQPASVVDLCSTLAAARAVVAMESGPAHLAAALDKPTVTLLGGGHSGIFAPWQRSDRQQWVTHPLPCYQCNWQCQFSQAHCLTDIPPERVVSALRAALGV